MVKKEELTLDRLSEFRQKYKKEKNSLSQSEQQEKEFIKGIRTTVITIFLFLIVLTWQQAVSFYMNTIRNASYSIAIPIINFLLALAITFFCFTKIMSFTHLNG